MTRTLLMLLACTATAVAQAPIPAWTLSPAPTLDIGNDASVHTQFNGVAGVLRMPRGEIIVANGMSQELRVFSASGAHLRTLAEPGTGAGRLRSLNKLWRAGDTIVASEILPNETSIHLFSVSRFLVTRTVGRSNAGNLSPVDQFPDGRILVRAARRGTRSVSTAMPFVDSARLGVVSFADLTPAWIGTLTSEMILIPGFGGGRGRQPNIVPYAFGRAEAYAVSGGRLWIGDSETGRIEQFDSQGRKLGQFDAPIPQRPFDSTIVRRQRTTTLNDAMNWNDRARIDASYSAPLPQYAPRFTRFVPGVGGEMWVELFSEDRDAQRAYVVLDPSGKATGRLLMPRGTVLFEVGLNYVMGVRRDTDGLEHVVQHTLTRR